MGTGPQHLGGPDRLFLDRNGRNLANPLRGMQPDFYGAYLEQAVDRPAPSRQQIRGGQ
jgi:hypothetical protein